MAQLDSASVFGTEGWGFESLQACFKGFPSVAGKTFFYALNLSFSSFVGDVVSFKRGLLSVARRLAGEFFAFKQVFDVRGFNGLK